MNFIIDKETMIVRIAKITNFDLDRTRNLLDAMIEVITNELVNGNKVKLVNFGEFLIKNRAGRKGFNPYYRKSVDIPPCKEPCFVPGKVLKEIINRE